MLTNSSTNGYGVWVGNTGITSADTVTVKGAGGLSNTGYITIQGSASATAKLVVTNTASSSGTITIDGFGDLTATAVDITGGTLEGVGTVTGALHVTGGTVVGGSLSSTPGTLTVSGSYTQSGSGILQRDIYTAGHAAIEHHQRDRKPRDAGGGRQRQSRRRDFADRRRYPTSLWARPIR